MHGSPPSFELTRDYADLSSVCGQAGLRKIEVPRMMHMVQRSGTRRLTRARHK